MTLSLGTAYRSFGGEVEASSTTTICRLPDSRRHQLWAIAPPVIAGALAATAFSLILVTLAAAVGLGVSPTAPTWRDASVALWILSGIYLILQAIVSFGFGAYIAGRLRRPLAAGPADEVESRDGLHGLAVWALAVVLGSMVAAFVGAATINRPSPASANASSAEPVLSYELDRLFRAVRRPPNVDMRPERAEAG